MVTALRIGEVAKQAGVNIQTLRYYERRGILPEPARSESGYRAYDHQAVQVVRFIKRAQDLGFTLHEIEDLLTLRQNERSSCGRVKTLASAKVDQIEEKLRALRKLKRALATLIETCETTGAALDCPILDALDDTPASKDGGRKRA